MATVPSSNPASSQNAAQGNASNNGATSLAELAANSWNQRQWSEAAKHLHSLLDAEPLEIGSEKVEERLVSLLIGICASFNGQYILAKQIFKECVQYLDDEDGGNYLLDGLDVAAAHWLGDTCLLLRELDNAALAWSIAWKGVSALGDTFTAERERLLSCLQLHQNGTLKGEATTRQTLQELSHALYFDHRTRVNLFPLMPNIQKAECIAAPVDSCANRVLPDLGVPAFSDRPGDITLEPTTWHYPADSAAVWKFQYDRFLLLDPRKFKYVSDWGIEVNYTQLDLRFVPNLHQEYKFISKVPVTSIYSTRKRSLKWIVSSLESALNARGFLCTHYFERMKIIRVRDFGHMDYVARFVVIFIRTPFYTVFGVQVPAHSVRTNWNAIHAPEIVVKNRLVKDLKDILAAAEARDEGKENDPRYRDIYLSTDVSWSHNVAKGRRQRRYDENLG